MRGRIILVFLLALLVSGGALAATRNRALASSSVVDTIDGAVFVTRAGVEASAREGQLVGEGDTIRTGPDGHAVLVFFDGSTVSLESDTEVRIEAAQAQGTATILRLFQTAGRTWNAVHKLLDGGSRYDILTDDMAAVVRGTAFHVIAGEDEDEVATDEGTVEVTAQAQTVRVTPGLRSRITHGRAPRAAEAKPRPARVLQLDLVGGVGAVVDARRRSAGVAPDGALRHTLPGARVTRDGEIVRIVVADPTRGMRFVPGPGLRAVRYSLTDATGMVVASGEAAPKAGALHESFDWLGGALPEVTPGSGLRPRTPAIRPSSGRPTVTPAPRIEVVGPLPVPSLPVQVSPVATAAPAATPSTPGLPLPAPLVSPTRLPAPPPLPSPLPSPSLALPSLALPSFSAPPRTTPAPPTQVPTTLPPVPTATPSLLPPTPSLLPPTPSLRPLPSPPLP